MWPFGTKSARRREIRRSKAEQRTPWRQRLFGRARLIPALLTLLLGLAATLMINVGRDVSRWRVGMRTPHGITSRVAFKIEDTAAADLLRNNARNSSPSYYRSDAALLREIRGLLNKAITTAKRHAAQPDDLRAEAARNGLDVDAAAADELLRLAALPDAAEFDKQVEDAIQRIVSGYLLEASELAKRRTPTRAVLIHEHLERTTSITEVQFVSGDGAEQAVTQLAENAANAFAEPLRTMASGALYSVLSGGQPDSKYRAPYRFDAKRTDSEARAAEAKVDLPFLEFQPNKSLLVEPGDIDQSEFDLIRLEHQHYFEALALDPELGRRERFAALAQGSLAFLLAVGLGIYLSGGRRSDGLTEVRLAAIAALLVLLLFVSRSAFVQSALPLHFSAGAQALMAAVASIVYPPRKALAVCATLAALIVLGTQQTIGFLVILMTLSAVINLGVRTVRNRGKIVSVGFGAGLLAAAMSIIAGLIDLQSWPYVLRQSAWAGGMTFTAGLFVEALLPFIERLFRLSTDMTLLEWCDANKPPLRLIAAKAPGTYNHSLLLGSMAQTAGDAVGANGLLARTGAYYHDIGKTNKPDYFIENQTPGVNRHEGLSPAMSLLIIISHVKDGIEMAKEYGLPADLRPFIAEHHGTTLVEYFYHAASKDRSPDDPEVADTQFRYPGPKPQSRETAIVMLCDGVEGAVRAMADPTPARIETIVEEIARKRLLDGQFDECDLTFRELAAIEQSLVKSLCAIYHGRISYPSAEQKSA